MKNSVQARSGRLLAVLLAMAVILSSVAVGVSAYSFTNGQTISGLGTIKSSNSYVVTNGLEYTKFTFSSVDGAGQTGYTMEFNPNNDALTPMVYQPKASYGSTTPNSVTAARNEGYTVYGGINGEFFSMNSKNYGTLEGLLVTNGKIVADSADRSNPSSEAPTTANREVVMAIDKDYNMNLVESRLSYHFYVEGNEKGNIGLINKRYVVESNGWWGQLCYFDKNAKGATYTVSDVAGVEVVFNKKANTELTIEGTLIGEVASVTTNSYGKTFNDDQFVLFAEPTSQYYSTLTSLKAGQEVQIYAEETCASSKEILKNAVTISSANYPIVVNGENNYANIRYKASDIDKTYAQRTCIGVKADGTYVYFCSAGRGDSSSNTRGVTLNQVANIMIGLGCVTAVNLDGGGSSTMVAGSDTVFSSGRSVGSSVLIVKRDEMVQSSTEKQALQTLVNEAKATSYSGAQATSVNAMVTIAQSVLNDSKSLTANYKRAYMDLQEAMGKVTSIQPKDYISLNASDWAFDTATMQLKNNTAGNLLMNNTDGLWPKAHYACDITVSLDETLYYDMTIAGGASIRLVIAGEDVPINAAIAPNNIDSGSGDIIGSGRTYQGGVTLSSIGITSDKLNADGTVTITGINIYVTGSAGNGSLITIRKFDIGSVYSAGDVNADGRMDSTDARMVLRHINNKITLSGDQCIAADVNGDGTIDSSDVRFIIYKAAGLSA